MLIMIMIMLKITMIVNGTVKMIIFIKAEKTNDSHHNNNDHNKGNDKSNKSNHKHYYCYSDH